MTERQILFSGPMIRALLAGTKTQTRRCIKPEWLRCLDPEDDRETVLSRCPYGLPGGSRLWVRETWAAPHAYDHLPPRLIPQDARIHYAATEDRGGLLWRPSIHMPRWASRITLEAEAVRVERLGEISESDAWAEGVQSVSEFKELWASINGTWEPKQWIWVLQFQRV